MKNFLQISKPSYGSFFLWPVVAAYASQNDTKFLEELCTRWYQTNSEWATILSEKDFFSLSGIVAPSIKCVGIF